MSSLARIPLPATTAVVAIIVDVRRERVLCVSRKGRPWEYGLPGGKVEPGESLGQALARELYEEVGLCALSYSSDFHQDTPGFSHVRANGLEVSWFVVGSYTGTPVAREPGTMLRWCTRYELSCCCPFWPYTSKALDAIFGQKEGF